MEPKTPKIVSSSMVGTIPFIEKMVKVEEMEPKTPKIVSNSIAIFAGTFSPFLEKMAKLRREFQFDTDMEMKVRDDLVTKLFKTKKYRSLDDISEIGS
jgi:hypothetical protein